MTQDIPFEEIGIPLEVAENIVNTIRSSASVRPNAPIEIQEVSETTGYLGTTVKEVFFTLLAFRLLKATFLPRHRSCGNIVGTQEVSADLVRQKAQNEEYFCLHCSEPIDAEDVEIQIAFWKPGADVSR